MKNKDPLMSPMTLPHPRCDVDGDKRDIHDHNPNEALAMPHERAKRDPMNVFQEGLNGTYYRGNIDDVAKDIVASPMQGQRRSATGEYESVRRRDKV